MTTFSSEQLNFFKLSSVVFDEFPAALRQVFVYMWDKKVAPTPGFLEWDDSQLVRNMFLHKEGGKSKNVPTHKSFTEWDFRALLEATLFSQSFAQLGKTLHTLYVKPRGLSGTFHPSVISPIGNQDETFALALDQLRLIRNALAYLMGTSIDKATFDNYIQLTKDAFVALGQSTTKVGDIGKLGDSDVPTPRLQHLEKELKRENFKQFQNNLDQIESEVKDHRSDVKDIKSGVTDVMTTMEGVASDLKKTVTYVKTKVDEVGSEMNRAVTEVETRMDEVRSNVEEVKDNVDNIKQAMQAETSKGEPTVNF